MKYTRPKKIFIVDDDVMLTEAMKDFLIRKGAFQVCCFHTGEDCLSDMTESPDVIILDYYLDTVRKDAANGLKILETIKKHFPGIHIIMLSGQERYGIAMQTIQKGAEMYVIKDENAFEKIYELVSQIV